MQKLIRRKAYKAAEPLNTINDIRNRLEKCDLFTIEHHLYYPIPNIYCCRVLLGDEDIRALELGSNGKGLNPRYSLASAYGEVMERLQNNVMIPLRQLKFAGRRYLEQESWTEDLRKKLEEEGLVLDYHYGPDESYLTVEKLVKECSHTLGQMLQITEESEQIKYLNKAFAGELITCLPYYSVFEDKVKQLPYKLIWNMCGSNGMCAGNTPMEAILQGLSEVYERYAVRCLYFEGLTPPTIPLADIEDPELISRIQSLEQAGILVTIKDCSLGIGLPVIGLIFHDTHNGKYSFHVGADPSPLTALARCISEFYQGNPEDINKRFHLRNSGVEEPEIGENTELLEAYYATVAGGMGRWPETLYSEGESYPFTGFDHPVSESDALDLIYLLELLKKLNKTLYIRDVSFLGFPAYQIFVPGMSETDFLFDKEELSNWFEIVRSQKYILHLEQAPLDGLKKLAQAIERTKGLALPAAFEPGRWFLSNSNKKFKGLHRDYLLSRIYLRLQDYKAAAKSMRSFLLTPAAVSGPMLRYKAEASYLEERARGTEEKKLRERLERDFGAKLTLEVLDTIGAPERAFSDLILPTCFHCEACPVADSCKYFPLLRRAKKLQELYKANLPSQIELRKVFNGGT